jgi:hypothetical protein
MDRKAKTRVPARELRDHSIEITRWLGHALDEARFKASLQ